VITAMNPRIGHLASIALRGHKTPKSARLLTVPLGPANGLENACVVSCDNIVTVPENALGRQIGYLLPAQEAALTAAIHAAFDLD